MAVAAVHKGSALSPAAAAQTRSYLWLCICYGLLCLLPCALPRRSAGVRIARQLHGGGGGGEGAAPGPSREKKRSAPPQDAALLSTSFILRGDASHNQAMVHWTGENSSVSPSSLHLAAGRAVNNEHMPVCCHWVVELLETPQSPGMKYE